MLQAAEVAGVTISTVYQWYWRGKLHAIKVHGKRMTSTREVRRAANEMAQSGMGRPRIRRTRAVTEPIAELVEA